MSLATNTKDLNIEQLRFLRSWCARMLIMQANNHTLAHRFMIKILEIDSQLNKRKQEATDV